MTFKLTLSVEKHVIEKAKLYAKKTGRSLPEIIEGYLESLTSENPHENEEISFFTLLSPDVRFDSRSATI